MKTLLATAAIIVALPVIASADITGLSEGTRIDASGAELSLLKKRIDSVGDKQHMSFGNEFNTTRLNGTYKDNSYDLNVVTTHSTKLASGEYQVKKIMTIGKYNNFSISTDLKISAGQSGNLQQLVTRINNAAYNEGYKDGFNDGFEVGYNTGWHDAVKQILK